ncbi:MAG: hypothetical protein AAF542_12330 [Pseudomonadota bacterium]
MRQERMILNRSNSLRAHRKCSVLAMVLVLVGCATATDLEVDVSQDFPSPLVVPAPVHMGIYISSEFEQYVFEEFENIPQKKAAKKSKKKKPKEEKTAVPSSGTASAEEEKQPQAIAEQGSKTELEGEGSNGAEHVDAAKESPEAGKVDEPTAEQKERASENTDSVEKEVKKQSKPTIQRRLKMRVALGDAQARMIRSVLPPVFESATLLDSLAIESRPAGMDLYVVPEIKRLQYTTPKSTRTKVYEIWLQYDFVIYDRNDDVVTRWNLPCYGKTPSAMMKSQKDALQSATQMALRDCGAAFSTGFSVHPAVQRWMQGEEQRQQRVLGRTESL